ncbi:ArsR/SmtB family transcription factor [Planomonospora venezuelensis]|uniref:DNA-binding transcriptional ArsR family regulator n=1 Tax=Planomonospora venezuelensis TaxID=1999 RepID=A0A841D8H1_PLAVE|nr:winged helix-turn-helix domain-containing protein [Planomonospora venezuelensis]MBB5965779.1 DNA-binding transcriptional ArsR family regulator [Planomonospora venezuelensis]
MTKERQPLSDPRAMRALAHPARLAILNKVQTDGTVTATEAAEVVGITPSAASYHLRMLAKYGFVEDAPPRGDGRERLWRGVRTSWTVSPEPDDQPEVRAAKDALIQMVRDEAAAEAGRALRNFDREPPEWREASTFVRSVLFLDAAEMKELTERIGELIDPYRLNGRDRSEAPPGARVAEAHITLFPRVERRTHAPSSDG